jgi:lysyl oxidase-like protein 2/3/4
MVYKPRGAPAQNIYKPEAERQLDILAADFFTMDGVPAYELMPFPHEPFSSPPQEWTKYDSMSVRDRLNQIDGAPELKDQFEALFNCFGCGTGDDTAFTSALQWYVLGGCRLQSLFAAVGTFKLGSGGMTNLAKHILAEFKGDRLFNTPVRAIRQSESEVNIACDGDVEIKAKRVICTIPLYVCSSSN